MLHTHARAHTHARTNAHMPAHSPTFAVCFMDRHARTHARTHMCMRHTASDQVLTWAVRIPETAQLRDALDSFERSVCACVCVHVYIHVCVRVYLNACCWVMGRLGMGGSAEARHLARQARPAHVDAHTPVRILECHRHCKLETCPRPHTCLHIGVGCAAHAVGNGAA